MRIRISFYVRTHISLGRRGTEHKLNPFRRHVGRTAIFIFLLDNKLSFPVTYRKRKPRASQPQTCNHFALPLAVRLAFALPLPLPLGLALAAALASASACLEIKLWAEGW